MLYLDSGECFAQGVREFSRTFTTQQSGLDRIVLFVQVEKVPTEAAIDTGGAYLFCNPQLADADGKLFDGMTMDGLHLSVKGCEVWAEGLRPILTELLGPPAATDHAPPPTGDPSASGR